MILVWLVVIPFAAGIVAWLVSRWHAKLPRWICLIGLALTLALILNLWRGMGQEIAFSGKTPWLVEINQPWISSLGISFHLALDGLSLLLILLSAFLGIAAVVVSWREIQERVGFFHFNLMWTLAGIIGVFLALDLFLFYFFWEMMLVPMYFLIALWGHENRVYASIKFFIFTQVSGLLMLLGILGLYFIHHHLSGVYTFNYTELLSTPMSEVAAKWLMLGFLVAFAVKLPVVPVHTWLADAHTEAPTAGSVILAGLLLKTGAYGLLRFVVPLFPQAALAFAPIAGVLAVVSILYGALLAFGQTDLKRLVAYTSISHMGFVFLGIFAWNQLALQGVVIQMVSHGISTGSLFILAGALQERMHTRDMSRMGGLWSTVPKLGGVALFFAVASLGLPGLGNFVGEFLVLLGTYKVSVPLTVLATLGLISATIYSLWLVQRTFHGANKEGWKLDDLSARETATMASMIAVIVWLGIYPQPLLNTSRQALAQLQRYAVTTQVVSRPGEMVSPLTAYEGKEIEPQRAEKTYGK
jgi:NADH-quinone oxidoreductase subunit M